MKFQIQICTPMSMNTAIDDPRILRGMEKQLQLRGERLQSGEKPIGWKIGFGAPASMERLKIDKPLIGFLTDKILIPSGTTISITDWIKPAVEPEIAVYLEKDLHGNVDRTDVQAAIVSMSPAIEIAEVNVPPEDVERILAENIYNRYVILGRPDPSRAHCILDGLEAQIEHDEVEIARTSDLEALTGNIVDTVCHAANLLSIFGESLRADEFIIMGSVIPPIWIDSDTTIQFKLNPIDTLSVNLEV
jgi:2-keto-4-pentenoate hydratase